MKNKEWLKECIERAADSHSFRMVQDTSVLALIDQLEEPEQEKVFIPQFVADWIEKNRDKTTLLDTKSMMIHRCIHEDLRVLYWVDDNDDLFIRAWLDGYTVEKEKLYRVIIKTTDSTQLLWQATDGTGNTDFVSVTRLTTGKSYFTEQEIKAIDERFWIFAEEAST